MVFLLLANLIVPDVELGNFFHILRKQPSRNLVSKAFFFFFFSIKPSRIVKVR